MRKVFSLPFIFRKIGFIIAIILVIFIESQFFSNSFAINHTNNRSNQFRWQTTIAARQTVDLLYLFHYIIAWLLIIKWKRSIPFHKREQSGDVNASCSCSLCRMAYNSWSCLGLTPPRSSIEDWFWPRSPHAKRRKLSSIVKNITNTIESIYVVCVLWKIGIYKLKTNGKEHEKKMTLARLPLLAQWALFFFAVLLLLFIFYLLFSMRVSHISSHLFAM